MDDTDKKDGTLPDSMKNHSDHSSIRYMGLHEKPVCLLLLSSFPVHLTHANSPVVRIVIFLHSMTPDTDQNISV